MKQEKGLFTDCTQKFVTKSDKKGKRIYLSGQCKVVKGKQKGNDSLLRCINREWNILPIRSTIYCG